MKLHTELGRLCYIVENFRISIYISYTGFLTSEENRMVILLTTWPTCWKGAKELFGRNNRYESVLRYQYFVSTLFAFDRLHCQNNLYVYSINKLLHGWLVCTYFTTHAYVLDNHTVISILY